MSAALWFLGLGYLVQGLRCFPSRGADLLTKDTAGEVSLTLRLLRHSPAVGKPLLGAVSDALYIGDSHRVPYVAIGIMLQVVSWLLLVLLSGGGGGSLSADAAAAFLLVGTLGASVSDVAKDAVVVEAGRLDAFVWGFTSAAAALGSALGLLLGDLLAGALPHAAMLVAFVLALTLQLFITTAVPEGSLGIPGRRAESHLRTSGVSRQLAKLRLTLQSPEVSSSLLWFASSYALTPHLRRAMSVYRATDLRVEPRVALASDVLCHAAVLIWNLAGGVLVGDATPRRVLAGMQGAISVLMFSDVLFVNGISRGAGISDSSYIIVVSGLLEALLIVKAQTFTQFMGELCPAGCEGSLMAVVAVVYALSAAAGEGLGTGLAWALGVSPENFSALGLAVLLQACCATVPVRWSSWIGGGGVEEEFAQFKIK